MKSVLFVAGEALPFVKTGGLADVIGSAPKVLAAKGVDARVVIPLYKPIAEKYFSEFKEEVFFEMFVGPRQCPCTVYSTVRDGVKYYFIQHAGYFERDVCYGYPDDGERFAFFQICVVEMLVRMNYFPDIIHNNDWQTGMIPYLCKVKYGSDDRYRNMKQIFMIHNIAFQGNYSSDILSLFGVDKTHFYDGSLRMYDGISYMKAGIVYADKVMTVSNTYAKEILTSEFGENLETVLELRKDDLYGVVDGIDVDLWNPKTDPMLAANYSFRNFKSGKLANKKALQEELGLEVRDDVMVVGMVARLTWQKGVYLISQRLNEILGINLQLVILGTGESDAEYYFREMENNHKGQAVYYRGYNEELAHRIYAGSDLFLMPSLYEPCGISQLISMRYGTLPLVRETGGLKDTVQPYNEYTKEGCGFSFANFNSWDLYNTLCLAAKVFYDRPNDWREMVHSAMSKDVSWEHSAQDYINIYEAL